MTRAPVLPALRRVVCSEQIAATELDCFRNEQNWRCLPVAMPIASNAIATAPTSLQCGPALSALWPCPALRSGYSSYAVCTDIRVIYANIYLITSNMATSSALDTLFVGLRIPS